MNIPPKGFIVPLLLIVIAILLAGGGAYVYIQPKQGNAPTTASSTTQTVSVTQTSDRKTYVSAKYGFSFSYPAAWTVIETQDGLKLTSEPSAGSDIGLTISSVSNKAATINCQPYGGEDINSIVNGLHSVECIDSKTSIGVPYTRTITAGQSTERTYREKYLNGYLLNAGTAINIWTLITDASGNTLPSNSTYTRVPATEQAVDLILLTFNWNPRAAIQTGVTNRPTATRILQDNNNLTEYEKALVARAKLSLSVMMGTPYGNTPQLKFYDNKTAVFYTFGAKGVGYLDIYDINTLEKKNAGEGLDLFGNGIESNSYILAIDDSGIRFYKKGALSFQSVPNSSLDSKEETYIEQAGMGGGTNDVTFDESTKTITASVFKPVDSYDANPKIRTVKFVLP